MSLEAPCPHCGTGSPVPSTYDRELDQERLSRQCTLVLSLMLDGCSRTLAEISTAVSTSERTEPEASCSARIREIRRRLRATHSMEKRRRPGIDPRCGVWEYQLLPKRSAKGVA